MKNEQPVLETERLVIREILPTDLESMFALDADPLVHQYLGNNPVTEIRQSEDIIANIRRQYTENGIGRWAMIEKSTGDFIGWTGLKLNKESMNGHTGFYDLGYRLLRKHWGKGYASESAFLSRDYAFTRLGLNELFAAAHVDNAASNKILKKIGFEWQETFDYHGATCNWYRLGKATWQALRKD